MKLINLQKIAPRTILPIAIITLFFSVTLYWVTSSLVQKIIGQNLEQNGRDKLAFIINRQQQIATDLLAQASMFSRADAVLKAYNIAYQGNIKNPDDPKMEEARQILRQYFSSIKKGRKAVVPSKNIRFHFHLPPARSLLRLWKGKQHKSDDLSAFRKTVSTISNGAHEPVTGIEIGRGGFAIRGIAPIFLDDKRYLGSVEMLSSYNPLARSVAFNEREYISVYMDSKYLSIATRLQDHVRYPLIGKKYVQVLSTSQSITDTIITPEILEQGHEEEYLFRTGKFFISLQPIKDFNGKSIGVIAYSVDSSKNYAILRKLNRTILFLCIFLFVCIVVPLKFVVGTIVKSINQTSEMLREIAEGKGDLTKRLQSKKGDEIGVMVGYFNVFLDQIQSIIRKVVDNSQVIDDASSNLAGLSKQMSESAGETSSRSELVATATEEMIININNIAASMEQSATNLSTVAASSEEMNATIDSIVEQTTDARTIADQAVSQAAAATSQMEELEQSAISIGKVLETISSISSQVNLLALNATIEAARAGESGKGFAVVASEIKDLAGQTSGATDEIKEKVVHIQTSTECAGSSISGISMIITKINEKITSIADAVGEQAMTTTEITSNIAQASQGIQEVNENINQSSAVIGEVGKDIGVVNSSARNITEDSNKVKDNAQQVNAMVSQLSNTVGNLKV